MISNDSYFCVPLMGTHSEPHKGGVIHLNEGTIIYAQAVYR